MKPAVLVIDPLSSPEYLLKRFTQLGLSVIALQTLSNIDDYFSYEHLPFAKILKSTKDLLQDLAMLQLINDYQIIHGFVGITACVPYAEQLLAKLFPDAANSPNTSVYRFDKFYMNEVLKRNGLSYIEQQKLPKDMELSTKIKETILFFKVNRGNMVIKPCSGSAGSVDVFSPTTIEDINAYYQEQHYGTFFQGDTLLQEKIHGIEYYIDAVAYRGKQQIVSVGRYAKQEVNGTFTYQHIDAIDKDSAQIQALLTYVLTCLNELQVANGFSHTEIIATPTNFKLIELNLRTSGIHGWCNLIAQRKYSVDQISAYVALLRHEKLILGNVPGKQRIFFFKNKKGTYENIDVNPIRKLQTYVSHEILHPRMDTEQHQQENLLTVVMLVLLESTEPMAIAHDSDLLLMMEQQGTCLL